MQLLISPASPFVRKVRVLLREAGLLDQVTETPVATSPLAPDATLVGANPIGKIPALIRDDGPALYDSRVITRYLDAYAKAGLYPESRIWEVLTLEATADGIMEAGLAITYEGRFRAPEQQSAEWVEAQWTKAHRAVAALEDRWISHLTGPITMGQIGVACALSYLDLRHDARNWRAGHPALADWHADFMARDSMTATAVSA